MPALRNASSLPAVVSVSSVASVAVVTALVLLGTTGCAQDTDHVDRSSDAEQTSDAEQSADAEQTSDAEPADAAGPGRVPLKHRAVAEACDHTREPGNAAEFPPGDPASAVCVADADCVAGENGRCVNRRDDVSCTYDECFDDSTCPTGRVCECEGGFWSDYNTCLAVGDCRTDADCGADGYCSPTLGDCGDYSGIVGYYCHTADDECVDDADCANMSTESPGPWHCAFNPAGGRWQCSNAGCVG